MHRILEHKNPQVLEEQIREHEAEGWVREGKPTVAYYPYGILHLQVMYKYMGEHCELDETSSHTGGARRG